MREAYPGYYQPTSDEIDSIWENAIFAFDASALLNLYRYTESTRNSFVRALEFIGDKLWLPYQADLEFHRNRLGVINGQAQAYDQISTALDAAQNSLQTVLDQFKRHPRILANDIISDFERALQPIRDKLEALKKDHPGPPISGGDGSDEVLDAVTELFRGRVGEPFKQSALEDIFREGHARYQDKRPPGYKDASKPEPERFGDLVIWKELLSRGAAETRPLVFVTDDRKEDWWWEFKGLRVGARVELVSEYRDASGQRLHLYTPDAFLERAGERFGNSVSPDSIGEVRAVSDQEQSREIAGKLERETRILRAEIEAIEQVISDQDDYRRAFRDSHALRILEGERSQLVSALSEVPSDDAAQRRLITLDQEMEEVRRRAFEDERMLASSRDRWQDIPGAKELNELGLRKRYLLGKLRELEAELALRAGLSGGS